MKRKREIERIEFNTDQLLAARDLQALTDDEARLRGLHVRAMHQTWGVALGYQLFLDSAQQQVLIWPGLAYDCNGREILLAKTATLPAPELPQNVLGRWLVFDLLLSAPPASAAFSVCGPALGNAAPMHTPQLRWAFAGVQHEIAPMALAEEVRLGEEIPLGRFRWSSDAGQLDGPDWRTRRNARALVRPNIAFGVTQPVWDSSTVLPSAWVDTSAGSFHSTPYYFASLSNGSPAHDMFLSIKSPSQSGFTLQLLAESFEKLSPFSIFWIGFEPVAGCQPTLNSSEVGVHLAADQNWFSILTFLKNIHWIMG